MPTMQEELRGWAGFTSSELPQQQLAPTCMGFPSTTRGLVVHGGFLAGTVIWSPVPGTQPHGYEPLIPPCSCPTRHRNNSLQGPRHRFALGTTSARILFHPGLVQEAKSSLANISPSLFPCSKGQQRKNEVMTGFIAMILETLSPLGDTITCGDCRTPGMGDPNLPS